MRLFHFSDDAGIDRFDPRPVRTPARRPPGMDWLNGPLVWAIAEDHQQLYLFPRECPRIVMWAHAGTIPSDRQIWLGDAPHGIVALAYIEARWLERLDHASLTRYELPRDHFVDINDAGMWVSHESIYRDVYMPSRKAFDASMFHRLRSGHSIRQERRSGRVHSG